MDNNRIKMIQERKKMRKRRQIITISTLLIFVICVLALIILGINSVVKAVKRSIPTPSPSPVAVISELDAATSSQNVEYTQLPSPDQENDLIKIIESSNTDTKVCYLTFDDGPNKSVTPLILDVLRKYNIKATFFQVGTLIEENPDVAKRVHEEGHLIGNHSYGHTYNKLYSGSESFIEEYNKCAELIQAVVGDDYFPVMRFPGGGYNSGRYGELKQELKIILAENNIYHCDWNALNGDAEGGSKTEEQLLERIKTSTKGKDKIVILMHDAANKKQTVKALPAIIEYLISENYVFARLDQPVA